MPAPIVAIEKLQKKLEKEPNSLIFLQLAEEYRKAGYYEEALKVCREGLRRHPNYWSARVLLGRIYHEMGEIEKAREELEKVIKAVPDNLLANKLLGDIYMVAGQIQDAYKRYQLVQMLTPNDQEVIANIQKIEAQMTGSMTAQGPTPARPQQAVVPTVPEPSHGSVASAPTMEIPLPSRKPLSVAERTDEILVPEPSAQRPSYSRVAEPPETLEKTEPGGIFVASALEQSAKQSKPSVPQAQEFHSLVSETPAVQVETPVRKSAESVNTTGEMLVAAFLEKEPLTSNKIEEHQVPVDRTQPMEEEEENEIEGEADELTTQTLAELYVQQGLIDKAVKVYQKLLLNDPNNAQIIKRLRELSPADNLVTGTGREERSGTTGLKKTKTPEVESFPEPASNRIDHLAEERRRKISTLENWLASIRRER